MKKTYNRRPQRNAVAVINGSEKYPDIKGRVLFYPTNKGVMVRNLREIPEKKLLAE